MKPAVSVIIPVLNDYERLELCLQALAEGSYPRARLEVIVVDNGTSADQMVDVGASREWVSQIVEPRFGSYAARNAGLERASGDIIAFTDADCIPAKNWLERGVEALTARESIGLVAGEIDIFAADPKRPTPTEIYEMEYAFCQRRYVEEYSFGATANVFTRRDVVESVGPFEQTLISGGDREWGQRVARAGFEVVYAAEASVKHPARRTIAELWAKIQRVGTGNHQLNWIDAPWWPERVQHLARGLRELAPPVRFLTQVGLEFERPLGERVVLAGTRLFAIYAAHLVRWRGVFSSLRANAPEATYEDR
jgi:glycosyltransferase involved in cell wall biosynthesis